MPYLVADGALARPGDRIGAVGDVDGALDDSYGGRVATLAEVEADEEFGCMVRAPQ